MTGADIAFSGRATGRRFGAALYGEVALDDVVVPALVFPSPNSGRRGGRHYAWLLAALAATTALLLGVAIALGPAPSWLQAIGIAAVLLLLVVFMPIGFMSRLRDVQRLALSERGVHLGPTSTAFIRWEAIVSVRRDSFLGMKGARLELVKGQKGKAPAWLNPFDRLSRSSSVSELAVSAANAKLTDEFVAVADYYLRSADERSQIGQSPPMRLEEPAPHIQPGWKSLATAALRTLRWAAYFVFLAYLLYFVVTGSSV